MNRGWPRRGRKEGLTVLKRTLTLSGEKSQTSHKIQNISPNTYIHTCTCICTIYMCTACMYTKSTFLYVLVILRVWRCYRGRGRGRGKGCVFLSALEMIWPVGAEGPSQGNLTETEIILYSHCKLFGLYVHVHSMPFIPLYIHVHVCICHDMSLCCFEIFRHVPM